MATNQNVLQLQQQAGSADVSSVIYAATGGSVDTGLPFSVLVHNIGLSGVPTTPTAITGTNTTQIASTAFTQTAIAAVVANYAPLANPTFTGTLTAPTGAFTTMSISSPLPVSSGGTGLGTLTATNVLIGTGTGAVSLVAPGSAGTLLASNGASNPSFQTQTSLGIAQTSGTLAQFASTTSAQLAGVLSDETGTGSVVFGTSPTIGTPTITGGTINNTTVGLTTPVAGKFTTLQATGTITPSSTSGIVGTVTNDNANAGSIGEYITATSSAIGLTSNSFSNLTTISLTAGDWDVSGTVMFTANATTVTTQVIGGISTVSATAGALGTYTQLNSPLGTGTVQTIPTPIVRLSLASTTTVYIIALGTFSTSTMTGTGVIRARRVR